MNIAIGKFGRSMYFDKNKWSIYKGDDSPLIIYFELAKRYPEHQFYIIGASDFLKFKENNNKKTVLDPTKILIPENIHDTFNEALADFDGKADPDKGPYQWEIVDKYIEKIGLHFDFGVLMQGIDMLYSIKGKGIKCKTKDEEIKPLCVGQNYCAPINYQVNKKEFEWINICEDPRYVPIATGDLFKDEQIILSQITKTCKVKRMVGYYEDSKKWRDVTLNYKYAGIEKMFFAEKQKIDFSDPSCIDFNGIRCKKDNTFIMTLNYSPDRLRFVENWILKYNPDVKIYGKWPEEVTSKYPGTFIEKGIIEMEEEMVRTKFTFVPMFMESLPNFVTQKPWKMIYYGIIPFWDKKTYDTDNYFSDVPDYFKVSSPQEMWDKIKYLEENPEEYKKYLNMYYNLLDDKLFNGDFIYETFAPYIDAAAAEKEGVPERS